jgi:16S rRNA (cytidine1402-2'-O)-methyltransferase
MMMKSCVYLIPTVLDETATDTIPAYVLEAVKKCTVIFAENERTARRFLKSLDKTIVIDDFEWFSIHKSEEAGQKENFRRKIAEEKNIAILSEAGCPGVADPGQLLIALAQEMNVVVKPLVGPSSILLALMASGMNGQQFQFVGYLPIDEPARIKAIRELELASKKNDCTQIFIETPYRNGQLLQTLLKTCNGATRLCVAADLTAPAEYIKTKKITDWKNEKTDLHKRPAIFLLHA